jgi:hypothetical protein
MHVSRPSKTLLPRGHRGTKQGSLSIEVSMLCVCVCVCECVCVCVCLILTLFFSYHFLILDSLYCRFFAGISILYY